MRRKTNHESRSHNSYGVTCEHEHEFRLSDALERPLSLADHANIARAKRPLLSQLAANRRVHSETATLLGSVVSFLAPLAMTAQRSLLLS
jgi:hypothetical protein